jgi:hypothetical protein
MRLGIGIIFYYVMICLRSFSVERRDWNGKETVSGRIQEVIRFDD